VGQSENKKTEERVSELAEAFGVTAIRSAGASFKFPGAGKGTMSFTGYCMARGIAGFTPEFVGTTGATFDGKEERVQVASRGCFNVMKKMGMIDGSPEPQTGIKVLKGNFVVMGMPGANRGGVVHRLVDIAVKLKKGTSIANILNAFGDVIEVVEMPADGYVWGWTVGNPATIDRNWSVQTGSPGAFTFREG